MAIPGQMNNTVYFEADDAKRAALVGHLKNQASDYGVLKGARVVEVPATVSKGQAAEIKKDSHDWRAPGIVIVAAGPEVKVEGMVFSKKKSLEEVTGIPDLNVIMPADLYIADTKKPGATLDTSSRLAIVAADRIGTQASKGGEMQARDTNHRDDERTMGVDPNTLRSNRLQPQSKGANSAERALAGRGTGQREL